MTTNPRTQAHRAADALDALARATIDNPGALAIPDLYAIASDLYDVTRDLAQVIGQLNQHVTTRGTRVPLRLDMDGVTRHREPGQAVAVAADHLTIARSSAGTAARSLLDAVVVLSTLAEVRTRP